MNGAVWKVTLVPCCFALPVFAQETKLHESKDAALAIGHKRPLSLTPTQPDACKERVISEIYLETFPQMMHNDPDIKSGQCYQHIKCTLHETAMPCQHKNSMSQELSSVSVNTSISADMTGPLNHDGYKSGGHFETTGSYSILVESVCVHINPTSMGFPRGHTGLPFLPLPGNTFNNSSDCFQ